MSEIRTVSHPPDEIVTEGSRNVPCWDGPTDETPTGAYTCDLR